MVLYITLILCAFLAALLVYRYDLYDREPWFMVLLAVALGIGAMRLTGTLELVSLGLVETNSAIAAVAALHEELARLLVVVAIALVFPKQFNDPMDGIVYGSMVGLGMALEESFYLLGLIEAPGPLTLPVEVVRLCGHLVMAGIVGFGVGLAWTSTPGWRGAMTRCLIVAFLLHFAWDWIALEAEDGATLSVFQTAAAVLVMLFGIAFYGSLVALGSALSKQRFAPDSRMQLWGWPFTMFLQKE